ncbi:MAG: 30S ribosomal protein S21 [Rhodospirillales bacterium]|nr:30S ribosomal protein S21 [Rhodospirillales bacterium]MCB9965276.1 30S ribosomal protein S21 [Rhodospirillales bacterium]MCB9972954.1 30S ribosomal protein S21 [Rhodospirillales bacterium]
MFAEQAQAFYFTRKGVITIVSVNVRDNNIEQALRLLKKKMQREGLFREMKLRQNFEKKYLKRAREKAEAIRRSRKMDRKRAQIDGF